MGLTDTLEQLWNYILISKDENFYFPISYTNLPENCLYGNDLQIALQYLREKFSSYNWSNMDSIDQINQAKSYYSRVRTLLHIIYCSKRMCLSKTFIYSHHCKEILLDLLDFRAEESLSNYGDKDVLSSLHYYVYTFRQLNYSKMVKGDDIQNVTLKLEDDCMSIASIKEIIILYNELSPPNKKDVRDKVEKALLFNNNKYLSEFEKCAITQLEMPLSYSTMELWYRLSAFEEKILCVLHAILPMESKFEPVYILAQICKTVICLIMQMHPKKYWEDVETIVCKLFRKEIPLCSKTRSFIDYTILALLLNRQHADFVDTINNIVWRSMCTLTDIQSICEALFMVDILMGHTGTHHATLLNLIHNRLNRIINSKDCSIQKQIGVYGASCINFYHIHRNTDMLRKIILHKVLFSCKSFEKQMILDLFSRMTALRLKSTFTDQGINKVSYAMAELDLFAMMTTAFEPDFIQLYAYVLIASTGSKNTHEIETKSRLLYNLSMTSGLSACSAMNNSMSKMAETIVALIQPPTSNTIEVGLSSTALPRSVRTAICGAKFAIVNIGSNNKPQLIREDCLYKIRTSTYILNYTNKGVHDTCFYLPIHPKDMNFSLNLVTFSETEITNGRQKLITEINHLETRKLYTRAYISWIVKTSGVIPLDSLINTCYEQYKDKGVTKSEISSSIQHLVECNILNWANQDAIQWNV